MKHLAAYLLAVIGGNDSPSAADVKSILSAASIEASDDEIASVLAAVEGKDLHAIIAEGRTKLVSVGGGGGGGGGAAAPAAAGGAPAAGAKGGKKEEEKKEEEEEDVGGAGGLFGGGDDDW